MTETKSNETNMEPMELLPLEMDYLPEFFEQKANNEINYSPGIAEKSLRQLKELMANENSPILQETQFKDSELIAFLTCRKFNVERVSQQLKRLAEFRKKNPIIFAHPSFDALSVFMTAEMATVLPWRCQDGCALIFLQIGKWNAKQHPLDAVKQMYSFLLLQCIRQPMTQVNGFKLIIDCDATVETLKICTPANMYLLIQGIFVAFPARFKAIHLLNVIGVGRIIWRITSVFLPAQIRGRMHIHKTNETLMDFFPKAVLPQKLGGDLKDYDMRGWLRTNLSPKEIFFR